MKKFKITKILLCIFIFSFISCASKPSKEEIAIEKTRIEQEKFEQEKLEQEKKLEEQKMKAEEEKRIAEEKKKQEQEERKAKLLEDMKADIIAHMGTKYENNITPESLKVLEIKPKGEFRINNISPNGFYKQNALINMLAYDMGALCTISRYIEYNDKGLVTFASACDISGEGSIEYKGNLPSVAHYKSQNREDNSIIDYYFSYDSKNKLTGIKWIFEGNDFEAKYIYDKNGQFEKLETIKNGTIENTKTDKPAEKITKPFDAEEAYAEKLTTYDENGWVKTFCRWSPYYCDWYCMEYEFDSNGNPVKSICYQYDESGNKSITETILTYEGNSVKCY